MSVLPSFTAVVVHDSNEAELLHMLGRLRYQTHPPDETIAVVSRIDTRPLARDFRDVTFVEDDFQGDYGHSARSIGEQMATGEWIGWFNGDDDYAPDYLESMLEAAAAHDADVVYCSWNRVPDCKFQHSSSTSGNFIAQRELVERAGGWRVGAYDADGHTIAALAQAAGKVVKVRRVLYWHNALAPLSERAHTLSGVIPRDDQGAPMTKKPAPAVHAAKSKTPTHSPTPKAKPHTPVSAKPIAVRALAEAAKYIGVTEHPNGSNRTQFGEWFGENGVAWCAIFVSYCFEVAAGYVLCHEFQGPGVVPGKGCSYVPTVESWAKDTGRFVPRDHGAQVGYLAFFNWNGGVPDHIGIVEKVHSDGTFDTIEGNTEDGAHTAGGGYVLRQKGRSPRLVDGFGRISG